MELLIRVKDKPSIDKKVRAERLHRGDVVAINPDDWGWTARELTNPEWRIFKIPALLAAEADAWLGAELDPTQAKNFVWRRARKIDLDNVSIPKVVANYLADNTRQKATYLINTGPVKAVFDALATTKPDADS